MDPLEDRLRLLAEKRRLRIAEEVANEAGCADMTATVTFPFLAGVYLAINAIRDARLVVEGPDCTYMKAQYVQGNHDLLSTLTSVTGWHRIVNTALYPSSVIASREEPLRKLMERVAAHPSTGGLLLTSMPMAFITGADYERICGDVAETTGREVIPVRGLSLRGDWIDGYAEVLRALARGLRLPEIAGSLDPRRVAIVGYLRDRNEADHDANMAELRELLGALGLELCATWLDGGPFAELARVAEAGTILSLPYGRQAAQVLARRTGARHIEMPLPFGLDACEHWARKLGAELGAGERAEAYVHEHLARIGPRLEWLVPTVFQNLNAGYVGDPHLLPGIASIFELLGARLRLAVVTNRVAHTQELGDLAKRVPLLINPRQSQLGRFMAEHMAQHPIHLLVTNAAGLATPDTRPALFELGFPSLYTHALYEKPFFGFRGLLAIAADMANTARLHEVNQARERALLKQVLSLDE